MLISTVSALLSIAPESRTSRVSPHRKFPYPYPFCLCLPPYFSVDCTPHQFIPLILDFDMFRDREGPAFSVPAYFT
jgi:hypothetical protein